MIISIINDFAVYEFHPMNKDPKQEIKQAIFFAHANGVPAQSYCSLFMRIVHEMDISIFSYDMRGIGRTKADPIFQTQSWGWQILIDDHIQLFQILSKKFKVTRWFLSGHSLGAWLSLFSVETLKIYDLLLLDPPFLHPKAAIHWFFCCLLNKRNLNPLSCRVQKRRISFPSVEYALQELKKSSFMHHWKKETILDYIQGSFEHKNNSEELLLRHDPKWEGYLFEQYPPSSSLELLKIPYNIRKKIQAIFFIGEKSHVCYPKDKYGLKILFPKMRWILIENASHMFPFEQEDLLIFNLIEIMRIKFPDVKIKTH